MKRLTAKQLGFIRNMIIIVGIALAFILWLRIPAFIENNSLVHVGNGKYGSKLGFLLLMPIPLFALIPQKPGEEIHTEDAEERAKIENEWETHSKEIQIAYAIGGVVAVCFGMILGIVLG
ncbi:MAG: hypothetical protein IJ379_07875 [Lachnospiraceae bacterium]|nr:hypothetical protein [Lachnospiraceae bacterium]MBQ7775825.1 hypothetical protein [Lachnospiraceae bacterium]